MIPMMINDTPIDCINQAAITYHVPAMVILSVMKKENGRNGEANPNKNGTFDYGVMQINSVWLPKISAYGYTAHDLQYNACKNVAVGTWLISQSIAHGQSWWSGVANYHSRTPIYHHSYEQAVQGHYRQFMQVIFNENTA